MEYILELEKDLVINYVLNSLLSEDTIAGLSSLKQYSTFLLYTPNKIDPDKLYSFEYGGVTKKAGVIRYLASRIKLFLQKDKKRNVVIFETWGRPTDPWLQKTKLKYFVYNDEVYLYLTYLDTALIEDAISDARNYPFVCVFTQMNYNNITGLNIPKPLILDIFNNTQSVFIGVYDDEAYLECKNLQN